MDDKSLIVIVTYNSQDYIEECLRSVMDQTYGRWKLVVVDNDSADETVSRIREFRNRTPGLDNDGLRLLHMRKNIGFSWAVNHAVLEMTSPRDREPYDYLILLNPDICLFPDALEHLVSTFAIPMQETGQAIGAAGGLILDYDRDVVQHRAGRITGNFITSHEGAGESFDREAPGAGSGLVEADYITGAFFATRYDLFCRSGGFDTGYRPVYFEELDYCLRLREAGWRIVANQSAVCRHFEGASVKRFSTGFYRHYHKNRLRCAVLNMDIPELAGIFLPAEIRWLRKAATRDQAWPIIYAYFINFVFLLYNLVLRLKNHFILNRIELK